MAVLQQPMAGGNVFAEEIGDDLAPAGTFVASILDIRDEFGVQRQKFQSVEMETVDLTTFLFGFRDGEGQAHRVASKRMKISGNEKSTLFGFLKSLLGRAPQYGWDYMELRGSQCLLTVEHVQRRDGTGVFAAIAALSPVPSQMPTANVEGRPYQMPTANAEGRPYQMPAANVDGKSAGMGAPQRQARPAAPADAPPRQGFDRGPAGHGGQAGGQAGAVRGDPIPF